MNGPHTPAFSRVNSMTRLIERVAQQNAMDGKAAGRMLDQFALTTPVISAARNGVDPKTGIARGRDFIPDMEDPRALMAANARSAALGISNDMIPQIGQGDDDLPGDIGHVADEPTDAEIDVMLARARGGRVPGVDAASTGAAAPGVPQVASTAAGVSPLPRGRAHQPGLTGARMMPNFANVEGFDLVRKVAVVDGMEFKLIEEDVVAMKKFAIQVVLDNVTFQLAQALVELGIPQDMAEATASKMRESATAGLTPGGMENAGRSAGTDEAVQSVRKNEISQPILQGSGREGQPVEAVQDVCDTVQPLGETSPSIAPVPANVQGSGEQLARPLIFGGSPDDLGYLLGDGEAPVT